MRLNNLENELITNPTPRVPVCLCLDTSGSMSGAPINELNAGVRLFYEAVRADDMACASADICIVSFGCDGVKTIQKFSGLRKVSVPPTLSAGGMTPMGEAVNLGLDLLEARKDAYKKAGVDYYQPWLVMMSDGMPNGDAREFERARLRIIDMCNNRKLTIFSIGIGMDADMKALQSLSPKRSTLRLKGLKFREFFSWLSQSVSRVSVSQPGETVKLDTEGINDWATL